ncbi:MAG: hypothetical protein HY294_03560 [Candidatus Rokubacteria bacterium]|nr:hypothetical protein [Candidatus Rokubacteria bacterium]MBI3825052.1 hypothetical protein [Candidatus Rokubacteria bacterium]
MRAGTERKRAIVVFILLGVAPLRALAQTGEVAAAPVAATPDVPPPVTESLTAPVVLPDGEVRQMTVVPVIPVAGLSSLAPGTQTRAQQFTIPTSIHVIDGTVVATSGDPMTAPQSHGPGTSFSIAAGTSLVLANPGPTSVTYVLLYALPTDELPAAPSPDDAPAGTQD